MDLSPRPDFTPKAARVLDLYDRLWDGRPLGADEYVISADEKSQLQALHRCHPDLPPAPGRLRRQEFEYHRGGTLAYLAAYDVHAARVIGRTAPTTGIEPFTQLVEQVMNTQPYASARRVFWIVDNGSSHNGARSIQRMRATWATAELVHLPVHASWLNQVEIFFSIVQRKVIKPGDFTDLDQLAQRLLAFQDRYNTATEPFNWRFGLDDARSLPGDSVDRFLDRGQHEAVVAALEADYLVVGAGAAGMAFTDALTDHADASVVMVDRRHGVGGHWLDAYPFVRLHQASAFYGVASTLLGDGRVQQDGPEVGLHERATAPEVCAYYARVLAERMLRSGRVSFYPNCDYVGEGQFVSRLSGKRYEVRGRRRLVDARYLSPRIPAETPAPFGTADGVHVVAVNELVRLGAAPSQYVIVGSGKTATDACIWLLGNGVDPGAICWVRPRDPWMLNRAKVQPDPAVFLGTAADTMKAASEAASPDDLFARLEEAGVMLRIDRSVTPTMAKTPTLAQWELDRLRTIEHVVRLGHLRYAEPTRLVFGEGEAATAKDAVIVHCAASGLQYRPLVPIWSDEAITLQPIRTGFPCFGAALAGYVEATGDGDEERNRLCPPSPYSDTPADWARMQVLGHRAATSFATQPDIKAWANRVWLNPARIPPDMAGSAGLTAAVERVGRYVGPGMTQMAELAGMSEASGIPRRPQ